MRILTPKTICLFALLSTWIPISGQSHREVAMPAINQTSITINQPPHVAPGDTLEDINFDELDNTLRAGMDTAFLTGLDVPAHKLYKIWTNNMVNPYQVRMANTPDTLIIPLTGYVHPIKNTVTSDFGFRRGYRYHYGTDIRLQRGDSVLCAFDGMIRIARRGKGYGYYVVVRHYNGLETIYGHFSKLTVEPNQKVKAGDLLGFGGSTGRSTGPHLHYEVRYLGVPVDPRALIDFDNYCVINDTLFLNASHFEYIKDIERIRIWVVKTGDTLSKIAMKTGISVTKLCQLNHIKRTSILRIGQRIRYT